jgi:hypothetical protein
MRIANYPTPRIKIALFKDIIVVKKQEDRVVLFFDIILFEDSRWQCASLQGN